MQTLLNHAKWLPVLLTLAIAPSLLAGLISFSGQFDPSLATVVTNGGDGWFDASGAPASVWVWGSDAGSEDPVYTLVYWTIATPVSNLSFAWYYQTFDVDGPSYDPAGYYWGGSYIQLSTDSGPNVQSGWVTGLNLAAGDTFGFYVLATDDIAGRAGIQISGVPEPGTLGLLGLGLAGVAALRRRPNN